MEHERAVVELKPLMIGNGRGTKVLVVPVSSNGHVDYHFFKKRGSTAHAEVIKSVFTNQMKGE